LPHTPQPGISRLRAFPCGLLARKWGSFSLLPDCVITHPVFLTPQTRRGRICPHAPGLSKARRTLVGSNSGLSHPPQGGVWQCVAVGCSQLEAQVSPSRPPSGRGREWQEGGGRKKSSESGTSLHIPTPPLILGLGTVSGSGLGRLLSPCLSCGLSCSGSPLITAAVIPHPRLGLVP
jgi:hypothetical protein